LVEFDIGANDRTDLTFAIGVSASAELIAVSVSAQATKTTNAPETSNSTAKSSQPAAETAKSPT
jgi:hypothetical protein